MASAWQCEDGLEQAHLLGTVRKLAGAGVQAGFDIEEMIGMLDAGMSVENLLNLIAYRRSQLPRLQ